MNRNAESYFALTPSLDISRSRFDMSHSLKSSANVGELIPIELMEVLPGDTFEYKTNAVFRMQPLVAPLMDDIKVDIFWFYAPMRILWNHTKEFFGENTQGPWAPSVEYNIPETRFEGWEDPDDSDIIHFGAVPGSIADYLGIPTDQKYTTNQAKVNVNAGIYYIDPDDIPGGQSDPSQLGFFVNSLPFRMYASIVNEFFRSEALQNPINIPLGDVLTSGILTKNDPDYDDYTLGLVRGGKPFNACKLFDYFTGALPTAQRSADPVMAMPDSWVYFGDERYARYPYEGVRFRSQDIPGHPPKKSVLSRAKDYNNDEGLIMGTFENYSQPIFNNAGTVQTLYDGYQPNNWKIDGVSVEQLRVAFQVQRFYEATARSGGRYREILESLYHVHASDQSMQIPQFLGSESFYLNINQVLQTSESGSTPQGNPAGISLTTHSDFDFIQSFTEHGYIMGLAVARYHHTYQQGLPKLWTRRDKFDLYWPQFANLGESPIEVQQIRATGGKSDTEVFGYQEAWAEYRYKPSTVTGEMRSNVPNSLDMYHLADDYSTRPYLGDQWIQEDKTMLDRCLAVTSQVANQFWFDMYFDVTATRPMPVHSIPGLIDHH